MVQNYLLTQDLEKDNRWSRRK